MSYNLEEQDQIEQLRAFWSRWGSSISALLLLAALAWAGWAGWQWWQNRQAAQAAALYARLSERLGAGDLQQAGPLFAQLQQREPHSPYAEMGALALAKAYADTARPEQARAPLEWAAAHAAQRAYRAAALLNLAALQIDAHQLDQALQTLKQAPSPAFEALFAARRGDVYALQGQREQARKAYLDALHRLPPAAALRALLQVKLDSVGGQA